MKSYFAAVLNELQVPFPGLNQLTNTRNYTVKEKMDFGNPKKLRFLTICILFRVLKRLEEEEGGGVGKSLQTL